VPWAQHIIDHQRGHARALDVAELLAPGEVVPADVDAVGLGVVAEATGTTWGRPSGPTVASRPSRWLPRSSISASLNRVHRILLVGLGRSSWPRITPAWPGSNPAALALAAGV
jgi:hypothetical protein